MIRKINGQKIFNFKNLKDFFTVRIFRAFNITPSMQHSWQVFNKYLFSTEICITNLQEIMQHVTFPQRKAIYIYQRYLNSYLKDCLLPHCLNQLITPDNPNVHQLGVGERNYGTMKDPGAITDYVIGQFGVEYLKKNDLIFS